MLVEVSRVDCWTWIEMIGLLTVNLPCSSIAALLLCGIFGVYLGGMVGRGGRGGARGGRGGIALANGENKRFLLDLF